MMHWFMMNYCFDHGYDRYNFTVYLVILLKIVKIMVFIALKEGLMYIEELIGDFYKPINKPKYWLFKTLNRIRKKIKNNN